MVFTRLTATTTKEASSTQASEWEIEGREISKFNLFGFNFIYYFSFVSSFIAFKKTIHILLEHL